MSLLKSASLRIPAIRRLHESRTALFAERSQLLDERTQLLDERTRLLDERTQLLDEVDALRAKCYELSATIDVQQRVQSDDAETRLARAEGRLLITEYPYRPTLRPIEQRPGGRRLIARLEAEEARYAAVVRSIATHIPSLTAITREEADPERPHWANDWLPPFDGAALYGFVAETAPRRYIEVGSGNSTLFVRQAIRDHRLPTQIISIDPQPRASIDSICDHVVRCPLEEVPPEFWDSITASDMLFIDNSHRSLPGSDVTVFFCEIVPGFKPGVLWGLHDIALPWDYPDDWGERYYNEQYMLLAYLLGGARGDEIVLPTFWISRHPRLRSIMQALWDRNDLLAGTWMGGSSFWLRRTADVPASSAEPAGPASHN